MSIRDLLSAAGDLPEGIKALLRQTQAKADRQDIENDLDTWTLNAAIEDGLLVFELDIEDDDEDES